MRNRLVIVSICVLCLIFIVNISRSIYGLWQKGNLVEEREMVLKRLQDDNSRLQSELKIVESPEYIEKQAREKLNLQREGEIVIVLPKDLKLDQPQETKEIVVPNWKKWWELIN